MIINKKGVGYTAVTTVEFFILLLVFGMLVYASVNANTGSEINKIRAKDLSLKISLIGGLEDSVKCVSNLGDEKRVEFGDNYVEVSNKDGSDFEKFSFNLNKNVKIEKGVVVDQFVSIQKSENKIGVK